MPSKHWHSVMVPSWWVYIMCEVPNFRRASFPSSPQYTWGVEAGVGRAALSGPHLPVLSQSPVYRLQFELHLSPFPKRSSVRPSPPPSDLQWPHSALRCSGQGVRLDSFPNPRPPAIVSCTSRLASMGRRQWHPTLVLLPGKSHGRRSLVGHSPWGH